jgi:hypothetical protein
MSPELESTLMLLYHVPGEATYEIKMIDHDGELGDIAQKLLERLPVDCLPGAAAAVWRAAAGDRMGKIRELQFRVRDLELELALRGVDLFQEAVG